MSRLFGGQGPAPMLISWEIGSRVAHQFGIEAKQNGAKFIEAEHMLLALASDPESDAAKLLSEFGLDRERLNSALGDERRRTLAFAGMKGPDLKLVQVTELESSPSLGTSAKAAVRRALIGSHRDHRRRQRLRSTDLLAGILEAELGTVPRALAIAGIDRDALIARARSSE